MKSTPCPTASSCFGSPTSAPGSRPVREAYLIVSPLAFETAGAILNVGLLIVDVTHGAELFRKVWTLGQREQIARGRVVQPSMEDYWADLVRSGDPEAILECGSEASALTLLEFCKDFAAALAPYPELPVHMVERDPHLGMLASVFAMEGMDCPLRARQVHALATFCMGASLVTGRMLFPAIRFFTAADLTACEEYFNAIRELGHGQSQV